MARAAPRRSPAKKKPRKERKPPPDDTGTKRPKGRDKHKPTKGERAVEKAEARRRRQVHRAGMRAIWLDRWTRFMEWIWPANTRDIGRGPATLVLILNIVPFPGLGTAIYGRVERGAAQFALTFLFLIGWVWAIADGIRIVQTAYRGDLRGRGTTGNRRSTRGPQAGKRS